jgi:hypothetical protein
MAIWITAYGPLLAGGVLAGLVMGAGLKYGLGLLLMLSMVVS